MKKRVLALLLAIVMLLGLAMGNVSAAEVTEKTVINFSASNMETKNLLYGTQFFTNWKTGDGLNSTGADLSGTAENGAHKKMFLRATVTLTALEEGIDLSTAWTVMGFRLRGDGEAFEAEFYNIYPKDVTMVNGSFDVSIPLSAISPKNITWSDVRQMNIYCNVANAYKLPSQGDSTQLKWGISNARVVREVTEGETDFDELADLLKTEIDKTKFTPASVAVLEKALADGQTVLENEQATQDEVDAAATAIATATKNLEYVVELYTARLEELTAETLTGNFTAETLAVYTAALEKGKAVLAAETPDATAVNAAVKELTAAKWGLVSTDENPFGEVKTTFASIAGNYDNLLYGHTVNTNWQAGVDLSAANVSGGGVDLSGDGENGADNDLYLRFTMAFTGLTAAADTDPGNCFENVTLRLRSSAVNNAERACKAFSFDASSLVQSGKGVYEMCIPLRYFAKENINWADVKELLVQLQLKKEYHRTTPDGVLAAGISRDIFFTLGQVDIVKKYAVTAGELDGEEGITVGDALMILQAVTGKITLTAPQKLAADVDGVDEIGVGDALSMLQYVTGKVTTLGQEERAEKMVAFTFDDGPSEYTATFLDQLKERNAHVTFFNVGKNSEKYPETLKRIVAEGHSIGNHGYAHQKGMSSMTEEEMHAEVDDCTAAIEEITGVRTKLLRAPWIAIGDRELAYAKEQGYCMIDYVGYVADFNTDNQKDDIIFKAHLDANGKPKIKDGEIILLHEVYQSLDAPGYQSLDACIKLIDLLQADGFKIVSVDELLAARAGGGNPGARYKQVLELQEEQ